MESLFKVFGKHGTLEDSLRDYLVYALRKVELKKKHPIVTEGKTSKLIGFIEAGVIRSYRDRRGREMTSWLMSEGDIFVSLRSFFLQEPATETIETLKPSIIHTISFEQYEYIIGNWPSFQQIRAEILQKYYLLSEQREDMRLQRSDEKYRFLMKTQPNLVDKVPDKYLASYLGVSPGTYSRAKHRYAKRNDLK
ncbi:MAG TPA: Crp/Fnr family transcriptional regulator [Puia sp.]|jgi:CRP-like cAMP-binding protein